MSSYLNFEHKGTSDSGKTQRWVVYNSINGTMLGWIQWAPNFRKYSYQSVAGIIYDSVCLGEIANFVATKTREHKAG